MRTLRDAYRTLLAYGAYTLRIARTPCTLECVVPWIRMALGVIAGTTLYHEQESTKYRITLRMWYVASEQSHGERCCRLHVPATPIAHSLIVLVFQMGTLFLNEQDRAIKLLFHFGEPGLKPATVLIFSAVFIIMECMTIGTWVCSGLFIPTLLAGAAMGKTWHGNEYRFCCRIFTRGATVAS